MDECQTVVFVDKETGRISAEGGINYFSYMVFRNLAAPDGTPPDIPDLLQVVPEGSPRIVEQESELNGRRGTAFVLVGVPMRANLAFADVACARNSGNYDYQDSVDFVRKHIAKVFAKGTEENQ